MSYIYDNQEFNSIRKLAEYCGVYEKTLSKRLKRGIPVEQACEKTDLRCRYFEHDKKKKSITQICKEKSKDSALITNRIRYGYNLDQALNTPKHITRQGKPIIVYGQLYNSVAEALRNLDLEHKESKIRRRLKSMSPDEAFDID